MELVFSRIFVLIFVVSITSCSNDQISNDQEQIEKIDEDNNTDENEKDETSASLTNVGIGQSWFNRSYLKNNPHDEIVLPDGCSTFEKTMYISMDGKDEGDGSISSPYKTIQFAVDQADPLICTLIFINSGTYLQTVKITSSQSKITFYGEDRENTILLSKEDISGWEKLKIDECPQNVSCSIYKKDFGEETTSLHYHFNDKLMVPVISPARNSFRTKINEGDVLDPSIIPDVIEGEEFPNFVVSITAEELSNSGKQKYKDHLLELMEADTRGVLYSNSFKDSVVMKRNDHSWSDIEAGFFLHTLDEKTTIYFKDFKNNSSPEGQVSKAIGYNFHIADSGHIVIQNLSIKNGRYGVAIYRDSHNIKLIGNIIKSGYRNIYIFGGVKGGINYAPSDIEIMGNQITNNFSMKISPQSRSSYRNFFLIKASLSDPHGIYLLNAGRGINIHHNFIYNVANGIQSFSQDKTSFVNEDLYVHHNLIINTTDDALEPGGTCINCHWYKNHVRNSSQAIRIKTENSNSIGPLYIYQNVLYGQDRFSYDENDFYGSNSLLYYHTGSEIPIYIFNNLLLGFRCFLPPTSETIYGGTNFYLMNNIFSCRYSLAKFPRGVWPFVTYDSSLLGSPSEPILGDRNKQPLFSHNWIGGEYDERKWKIRPNASDKLINEADHLFLLAQKSLNDDPENPLLNWDLNYIYTSDENLPPREHIIDSFNLDIGEVLSRIDFCPDVARFPEIINGGIDVHDNSILKWDYVDQTNYSNLTYLNKIERSIPDILPDIFGDGKVFIGPFSNNIECKNLNWLLGN